MNDYYEVDLKERRLEALTNYENFQFVKADLADRAVMQRQFAKHNAAAVINLAAQAGVRYSITNPHSYIDSNIVGFMNVLEGCRDTEVEHLVYASSSSVYGGNAKMPFSERDSVDHPVSMYAATKKANELMAHTYSHLFNLPTTGLRFFTVYGPWGRPDMAYFLFTKAILEDRPIDVFNHGQMQRDFTYIDDIVESIIKVLDRPATPDDRYDPVNPDPGLSQAPFRIFNIGNNQPVRLLQFVEALEAALGKKAIKNFRPIQAGDVTATFADVDRLVDWIDYGPTTDIEAGLSRFVKWYRDYYGV
ncbi:UDP-glucose 4-epimerase [Mycolicibacterium chlorophenolicum]|uniref:UDP-glucose 4-epimerase n=2 Tax=Mycolicibacterium chlorophenolicum TaxID=37916 RepID=A0A0J6VJI6_9MYCO|nr:UDP-glucose 4-epimerase [Mycolicibacterium chlorophenolicum]